MSGLAKSLPVWGRRFSIPRTRAHRSDGQRGDSIPYTSTRAGHGGCGVEIFGGLLMKVTIEVGEETMKEVRGGVFPGTEDGADE